MAQEMTSKQWFFVNNIIAAGLVALLPGSLHAGGYESEVVKSKPVEALLVKLKSVSFEDDTLVFMAKSNGCSQASDFRLSIEGDELSVFRVRRDLCRKMPAWKSFRLPLDASAVAHQLLLSNPLFAKGNKLITLSRH